MAQVSAESGAFLHWSDSQTLHWSTGPEYFTRSVAETFAFVGGGAETETTEPETAGVDLGFSVAAVTLPLDTTRILDLVELD